MGLKIDKQGRLFVAGGSAGTGRVIDVGTGKVIWNYQITTAPSFVNDVVLPRHYAWFTDSLQALLYGVPLGRHGKPGRPSSFVTLPLTRAWDQVDGFNANGIAQRPNRGALLVINSTSGVLFRVNPQSGRATKVDLGGTSLTAGDGLLVLGKLCTLCRTS
jgi:sugar lactone lactonase YvrE